MQHPATPLKAAKDGQRFGVEIFGTLHRQDQADHFGIKAASVDLGSQAAKEPAVIAIDMRAKAQQRVAVICGIRDRKDAHRNVHPILGGGAER